MSRSRIHSGAAERHTAVRHSVAAPRPRLALRGARAEAHSGVPPHCAVTVRVLDRVYFSVGAGDCVVVQHRDPGGVRVLLAALAGVFRQPSITVRGTRIVRAGVRVRRTSIRADLVPTLVAAWRARRVPATGAVTPTVHLLRASRREDSDVEDHHAWSAWAAAQRAAGGALVIVADADDPGIAGVASPTPIEVHERSPHYAATLNDHARTTGVVRACRLRHGRIAAATALDGSRDYCWLSEAPDVLGP
jgi:hypothetical protein